jgi:hypothetical protein
MLENLEGYNLMATLAIGDQSWQKRGLPRESKCMQTERCPTECMALKCTNVCNHEESVSGRKTKTVWAPFLYCHSQYSLRMQIIPINDLHSGRTRLHICSAPVMEQSHCGCDHVVELREHFKRGRAQFMRSQYCTRFKGSRLLAGRSVAEICTKGPKGQLSSQPCYSQLNCQLRSAPPGGPLCRHSYAALTPIKPSSRL